MNQHSDLQVQAVSDYLHNDHPTITEAINVLYNVFPLTYPTERASLYLRFNDLIQDLAEYAVVEGVEL